MKNEIIRIGRKSIKIFLACLVCIGAWTVSTQAAEPEEPKQLQPIVYTFDEADICAATQTLIEDENAFPVYAEGNHEKWIDRLEWPWYGTHFYNKILAEGTDNDYVNDFFIDPKNNNAVGMISLWDETENGEWVEKKVPSIIIHNGLYAQGPGEDGALEVLASEAEKIMEVLLASYGAFQMDHPEVFWLNDTLAYALDNITLDYDEFYDVSIARASLYLVLEMEYEGETYTFNHKKYTDTNTLRQAIADMDTQINTIVNTASDMDAVSKIEYYNNWLIMNNEMNDTLQTTEEAQALYAKKPEVFECISALYGNTGDNAPVPGAYTRAFKVLCDRSDIPCVINSCTWKDDSIHVWNQVQIDGSWYAVDVPCNESESGASGLECKDYVLIGHNTEITDGEEIIRFGDSHKMENVLGQDSVSFMNGPELCNEAYVSTIDEIILTASKSSFYPDYDEYPVITAEVIKAEGVTDDAEYTWYLKYDDGRKDIIEGETTNSITFPTIEYGGSYTLVVEVKVGNCTKSNLIIIDAVKFNDIYENTWYYKAVQWAFENGITYGYTIDRFGIEISCSRAQVVTFMWRAAGCPEPEDTEVRFKDVEQGDYFYKAVQWAVSKGITSGYSDEIFAPNDYVTRAQFVSFLWRENGRPSVDIPTEDASDNNKEQKVMKFEDVAEDAYYYKAVYWAVQNNITAGYTDDTFVPDDTASRAVIVTLLYRAKHNLPKTEVL